MTQFKQKFAELTSIIEQNLTNCEAYYNRSLYLRDYFYDRDFDSIKDRNFYHNMMEADLGKAIGLKPDYIDAYLLRSRVIGDAGDEDGAYEDLLKVMEMVPQHILGNFEMGYILFKKERFDEAMVFFDKAIELKPDYGEAFHYRAHMAGLMDRDDQMEEDYDMAIKLLGEDAELYSSRGGLYLTKEIFDKAMYNFNKAIELEPLNPDHYINKSRIYELQGEDELSYDVLLELSQKNPDRINKQFCAGLHTNRGVARITNKDHDGALDDFNKALEYAPDMVEVLYNRAMIHTIKKQYEKAAEDYKGVIAMESRLKISKFSKNARRDILGLYKEMGVKLSRWQRFKNWLFI